MKRLALSISALLVCLALAACGGTTRTVTTTVVPERPAMPLQYAGQKCPTSLLPVCHGGRYRDPTLFKAPPTRDLIRPPGASARRSAGGLVYGYDTVSLQYVPANAAAVAGYVDGYANCSQVFSQFPSAHKYCYAIHAYDRGDCLDMEPGAAYPSQEVAWVRNELAHRSEWDARLKAPCLYSMESWMGSIIAYANQAGLRYGTDYTLVTAAWNGVGNVPAGRDGHQYKSDCCLDWDVWNASFFRSAKPPPPAKPRLTGTANFGAAFATNWSWGIHGVKGSVKGSSGYRRGIAAEVQVGRSHKERIRGLKATAPPIGGKTVRVWWPVKQLFPLGLHFTFQTGAWKVWGTHGTVPKLPKGCDRLSAEVFMATHGANAFKPEIRRMVCDAGPLFGVHGQ